MKRFLLSFVLVLCLVFGINNHAIAKDNIEAIETISQIGSLANNGRDNNRVIPGKTMSGHWGPHQATIENITVVASNAEKGYILVRGGVPGAKKSIVKIRSAVKASLQKYAVKPVIDRSVKAETAE